jgi:hypothetical protein
MPGLLFLLALRHTPRINRGFAGDEKRGEYLHDKSKQFVLWNWLDGQHSWNLKKDVQVEGGLLEGSLDSS